MLPQEIHNALCAVLNLQETAKEKLLRAILYGREAHDSIGQKRKYTGLPYWVHTEAVALQVAQFGGSLDEVIAALLHDVLEDVTPLNRKYNIREILIRFGNSVARMVMELTDVYTPIAYPNINRATRKFLEAARLQSVYSDSKKIKACDLLDNTADIVVNDPKFAIQYLKEKDMIVAALLVGMTEYSHGKSFRGLDGEIASELVKTLKEKSAELDVKLIYTK